MCYKCPLLAWPPLRNTMASKSKYPGIYSCVNVEHMLAVECAFRYKHVTLQKRQMIHTSHCFTLHAPSTASHYIYLPLLHNITYTSHCFTLHTPPTASQHYIYLPLLHITYTSHCFALHTPPTVSHYIHLPLLRNITYTSYCFTKLHTPPTASQHYIHLPLLHNIT